VKRMNASIFFKNLRRPIHRDFFSMEGWRSAIPSSRGRDDPPCRRFTSEAGRLPWNMSISEEQVKNALKSVKYPGFTRDVVSFGLVKSIQIDNGDVKVQLALATNDPNVPATIKNDAERALGTIEGIRSAKVLLDIHAPPGG